MSMQVAENSKIMILR